MSPPCRAVAVQMNDSSIRSIATRATSSALTWARFATTFRGIGWPGDCRVSHLSRTLIEQAIETGALKRRGLELLWVDDPVDVFFLHIQGSGRVELDTGGIARVGYAGQNGHPYYAIGRELVVRDGGGSERRLHAEYSRLAR